MSKIQDSFRCSSDESLGHVIKATNRHTDMRKTLAYKSIDQEARSRREKKTYFQGAWQKVHAKTAMISLEIQEADGPVEPRHVISNNVVF